MPESAAPLLLLDVGGTDVKAALAPALGAGGFGGPRGVLRVPVVKNGDADGRALVEQLVGLADRLLLDAAGWLGADRTADRAGTLGTTGTLGAAGAFSAAGLLVPGIVDAQARRAVFAANLGLRNAALPDALQSRLGAPVGFGHDVGCAAEAEVAEGVGAGSSRSTLVVVIGTGIAATAFVDGRRVEIPGAGELGHVPVPGGRACSCGATGCLETVASAAAIAHAYTELTGQSVAGAAQVLELVRSGDPAARAAWDAAVEALAFALHWCVGLLGTTRVVLGGGLSGAGEELLAPLRVALASRLSFMPVPELVRARLGGDAGLIGAKALAERALSGIHPAGARHAAPQQPGAEGLPA